MFGGETVYIYIYTLYANIFLNRESNLYFSTESLFVSCPTFLYNNKQNLTYNPNNMRYGELNSYFWKTYTLYRGVYRDQSWRLLYVLLDHFNCTPSIMTAAGIIITKNGDLFKTCGTL